SAEVEVDSPRFGNIHLIRSNVGRFSKWHDGVGLIYLGPNGLADWDESSKMGHWREEAGHLVAYEAGATITSRFELPAQASIEFEISWTAHPDFVLALGVGDQEQPAAATVEVWDDNLVLLQETKTEADLASLQRIKPGAGRAHFQIYLDQQHNRVLAVSSDGALLADLSITKSARSSRPGIRLINRQGNVRLEQLRITRWDGQPPRQGQRDKSCIYLADDSILYGTVERFDADAGQFIVRSNDQTKRLAADQIGSVVLPPSENPLPRNIRVVCQDGVRLSGQLRYVKDGRLCLACPGVKEPLTLPVDQLRMLLVLDHPAAPVSAAGRSGRLEMDGVRLKGYLVGGSGGAGAGCLAWRPLRSATASSLSADVSARIVYRDPLPKSQTPAPTVQVARAGGLLGAMARALAGSAANPVVMQSPSRFGPSLYLRTGDTIPCQVERIDERGVTFRSTMFDATFVPHDKIKAVELENRSLEVKIDREKRDRLLTLPRMQKDDPPTHLIRSIRGDYLRARLIAMDDKTVTAEVRLDSRQLPREYVSQIIWLHADESAPPGQAAGSAEPSTVGRVQALREDGIRLTFSPEALTDATLCGTSDVLGPCRVALSEVDQLLIGSAIEQAAP
ncbi:MAG: TlpA family protein disulfide reductase, partial [Planctomycetes bacterium]|nr:TlpA family protein disulfide reductase [Planctomycetota bacterium]